MTFEKMMELSNKNKLTLNDVVKNVDIDNGDTVIKFIEKMDKKSLERLAVLAIFTLNAKRM